MGPECDSFVSFVTRVSACAWQGVTLARLFYRRKRAKICLAALLVSATVMHMSSRLKTTFVRVNVNPKRCLRVNHSYPISLDHKAAFLASICIKGAVKLTDG